jgi:hypothetical protein
MYYSPRVIKPLLSLRLIWDKSARGSCQILETTPSIEAALKLLATQLTSTNLDVDDVTPSLRSCADTRGHLVSAVVCFHTYTL